MRKLLVLVSPDGDAMMREAFECTLAVRDRYDVTVLAASGERERYEAAGIAYRSFRPASIYGMATSISRLRKTVERFAPDVVHAHGFPAVAVALGTMPASLAARTIATFHDPQRDRELPQKLVERKLPGYLRRAGALTIVYPTLEQRLRDRGLIDDAATPVTIPHGVAVDRTGAQLARPPARPGPVVGWSGRLAADRSWETAIDGFALVRAAVPSARMEISGSGRARQFVAAYVREKRLADAVTFRGDVAPRDFFATIDLLAVPKSRDALPHAPLEALVAGIPIVAAETGALVDVLGPCDGAWLVPDDGEGFRDGILDAWSRIDAAWSGAAASRYAARDRYGRDRVVASYDELYERVANAPAKNVAVSAQAASVTAGT
ncbi:MAG: glycosyltransferase family 4 protein [Candidatus Eremiobacteraeota bacterium]|nr:glycosyltransferase family 4 protein [Candidatus Eremiobacteraeota bacterium]